KEPDDRWHSARDVWLELKSAGDRSRVAAGSALAARPSRRVWIAGAAIAIVLVAAAFTTIWYFRSSSVTGRSIRFNVPAAGPPANMAISPDGSRLAFAAPAADGQTALWIRALNSLDARILAGT